MKMSSSLCSYCRSKYALIQREFEKGKSMNIRRTKLRFSTHLPQSVVFLSILLVMCGGGCSSIEVASRWPDQKIAVDGNASEWTGKTLLLEDRKLTVGIMNDSNFVYMLLATNDRQLSRAFLTEGITLWFDNQGGRERNFGIRYPLGMRSGEGGQGRAITDAPVRSNSPFAELEILGPGNDDRRRMSIVAAGGLQAKINPGEGSFVYELRVPYKDESRFPFSIKSTPGSFLGVGIETSSLETPGGTRGGSSAGSGGGRGRGGRGGGGGGNSGGSDQGAGGMGGPIKDWIKVQLISPDSVRTY